jgi:geranylgeranyl diphosphate synthase, type II
MTMVTKLDERRALRAASAPSPMTLEVVAPRIEEALRASLATSSGPAAPPTLVEALHYAVFPGGARLRPQLCVLVAASESKGTVPSGALHAAVAVELLHCASLVHDDLPCFDDADVRRGRPAVHRRFGEPLAVLAGDALIVQAFREAARAPEAAALVAALAEAAGPVRGLVAGQAWESERAVPLGPYHDAKTASLFEAAATMGAIAVGADPARWQPFGEAVGRAYQAADDIADALGDAAILGKPVGQDEALARPSLVRSVGLEAARRRLATLLARAQASIPTGMGASLLGAWLDRVAARLGALR